MFLPREDVDRNIHWQKEIRWVVITGASSGLGEATARRQVPIGHGRLRCLQSCAFHLIVVAVQHLPVCIHKVHLAVAGRKLVP